MLLQEMNWPAVAALARDTPVVIRKVPTSSSSESGSATAGIRVSLTRPRKKNAVDVAMASQLWTAIEAADADADGLAARVEGSELLRRERR